MDIQNYNSTSQNGISQKYTRIKRHEYIDNRLEKIYLSESSTANNEFSIFQKKYQEISTLIKRYHEFEYEKVKELTDLTKLIVFGVLAACGDENSLYIDESTLPETKSYYSFQNGLVKKHQTFVLGSKNQAILGNTTTLGYESAYPNSCLNILVTLKFQQLNRLINTQYGLYLLMEELNEIIPLKLDFKLAFRVFEEDYSFTLGESNTLLGYSTGLLKTKKELPFNSNEATFNEESLLETKI